MKRSEINAVIRDVDRFLQEHRFHLPPFAHWSPDAWAAKGNAVRQIVERGLGWDVTDFGRGEFERAGLAAFTLRNGSLADLQAGTGELYCEKALIVGSSSSTTPLRREAWPKATSLCAPMASHVLSRQGGALY
jgi:D-lyxose ketol-isomerase